MSLKEITWLITVGILLGFLLAALLVRLILLKVLRRIIRRFAFELENVILVPLRGLIIWGLILMGFYYSISNIDYIKSRTSLDQLLDRILSVGWLMLALWTTLRVFNALEGWYVHRVSERSEGARDATNQAALIRKTVNIVVLAMGVLMILKVAGVDTSPLLASGAVGGIAIALALQDTLSNVFAGYYMAAIDTPIHVGDYIKLQSGEEGFVQAIGWRNTTIRMWADNVVVIPNSKLSQNIITNYHLPHQDMSLYVQCGVAYDSDLQHVEEITLEVARQLQRSVEGADDTWEPTVRWKEFGDSSITFTTALRIKDFGAQYLLQSEYVKALHKRFMMEGIEIPFPIRTVIMKKEKDNTTE